MFERLVHKSAVWIVIGLKIIIKIIYANSIYTKTNGNKKQSIFLDGKQLSNILFNVLHQITKQMHSIYMRDVYIYASQFK